MRWAKISLVVVLVVIKINLVISSVVTTWGSYCTRGTTPEMAVPDVV